MEQHHEEYTFLCGSQRIRRYGSLNDSLSNFQPPKYSRIIVHKVEPTDTIQNLELRYNSSMFEIKRLNKLWSNQSLHCKSELLIPLFEGVTSISSSGEKSSRTINNNSLSANAKLDLEREKKLNIRVEDGRNDETLDQFFKRIDFNVKKTKKIVKKLNRRNDLEEEEAKDY